MAKNRCTISFRRVKQHFGMKFNILQQPFIEYSLRKLLRNPQRSVFIEIYIGLHAMKYIDSLDNYTEYSISIAFRSPKNKCAQT